MPPINIDVPSEWDIYRISYLVHKGWKRHEYNRVPKCDYNYYSHSEPGEEQEYCWEHPSFVNKDSVWGNKRILITRGNKKGEYKEEHGIVDSPYFTLDQAWDAQENEEAR